MKNLKYNLERSFLEELKRILNVTIDESEYLIKDGKNTGIIMVDIDLIRDRIDYMDLNGRLQVVNNSDFLEMIKQL